LSRVLDFGNCKLLRMHGMEKKKFWVNLKNKVQKHRFSIPIY
jgi:hypothetical protein